MDKLYKQLHITMTSTYWFSFPKIAEALFEITLPRFSGDILPKSDAGIVLAIADR